MGQFSYKAVDETGAHVSGTVEAPDRRSAVAVLAERGQFVVDLRDAAEAAAAGGVERVAGEFAKLGRLGAGRVGQRDVLAIMSQLSAALRAGLPLLNALEIIRDQQNKRGVRALLDSLVESVSGGHSLSEAMEQHPRIFGRLEVSMVRVGETGGILEQTTEQLKRVLERDQKIKTSMKNASAYPVFVLGLGLISAVIVITKVLPRVLGAIDVGAEMLPFPTRVLLGVSGFIKSYGLIALVVLAAGGYFVSRWVRGAGRLRWDGFKLKVPVLGSVLRAVAVGRFARTLGALTKGGVTILDALTVVRDTLGNEVLGRCIDEVAEKVKTGSPLAQPLGMCGRFPPLLVQIVSVGEQTGKLDTMLLDAAETFDAQADAAIARFMAILPAVLVLILALVIGLIIAATLLPVVMMELGGGVL